MVSTKTCWHCGKRLLLSDYNKNSSERDGYQKFCRKCQRVYGRKRYQENIQKERIRGTEKYRKIKEEVFGHYGSYCQCCGETILDFLAIDHILNDGYEHRKTVPGGIRMYYWLKKNQFPDGFQVLCHNCNWSKHANHGQCIHKIRS